MQQQKNMSTSFVSGVVNGVRLRVEVRPKQLICRMRNLKQKWMEKNREKEDGDLRVAPNDTDAMISRVSLSA